VRNYNEKYTNVIWNSSTKNVRRENIVGVSAGQVSVSLAFSVPFANSKQTKNEATQGRKGALQNI
jgi:hypothetical protein